MSDPSNQESTVITAMSKHELEVIKLELEQLFQSKLYQLFIATCESTRLNLLDAILGTTLKGIESLFTRESVMGEAQCWKNVEQVFSELLEDVNQAIRSK